MVTRGGQTTRSGGSLFAQRSTRAALPPRRLRGRLDRRFPRLIYYSPFRCGKAPNPDCWARLLGPMVGEAPNQSIPYTLHDAVGIEWGAAAHPVSALHRVAKTAGARFSQSDRASGWR